ncbi:hypothetical protein GCM10029964_033380 [Kibdelosporangium lantanae]
MCPGHAAGMTTSPTRVTLCSPAVASNRPSGEKVAPCNGIPATDAPDGQPNTTPSRLTVRRPEEWYAIAMILSR